MQTQDPQVHSARHAPPVFSREELLTVAEVADILRVKKATALEYMRRGLIPAFKIGRSWYSLRPRLNAHVEGAENPYG